MPQAPMSAPPAADPMQMAAATQQALINQQALLMVRAVMLILFASSVSPLTNDGSQVCICPSSSQAQQMTMQAMTLSQKQAQEQQKKEEQERRKAEEKERRRQPLRSASPPPVQSKAPKHSKSYRQPETEVLMYIIYNIYVKSPITDFCLGGRGAPLYFLSVLPLMLEKTS